MRISDWGSDVCSSDLLGAPRVVAIALIVGGIAILVIERFVKRADIHGVAAIPLGRTIGIGFIQCLALIPGVSRSGATILGALPLGVERRPAPGFSFFLAIPPMQGASPLELFKYHDHPKKSEEMRGGKHEAV